jgi:hypothetical protein
MHARIYGPKLARKKRQGGGPKNKKHFFCIIELKLTARTPPDETRTHCPRIL